MKRLLVALAAVLALAGGVVVSTPKPADATVFGCATPYQETQGRFTLFAKVCAEHLGDGHYRSWASAFVYVDGSVNNVTPSNFGFYSQRLWYYCYDGDGCNLYDGPLDNLGYIGVYEAISVGNSIGCPGASNQGEVGLVAIQWRPGGAGHPLYGSTIPSGNQPDHIPFSSSC